MVAEAIGIGLVISLIFSETLGVAAGGMVVPGYIALMLEHPTRIVGTVVVSLVTLSMLKIFSRFMFIYGRRRLVITLLIGFILGELSRRFLHIAMPRYTLEFQTIGYIIPGLIANWMERQGILQTLSVMFITAVFVRLLLIIFTGGRLLIMM